MNMQNSHSGSSYSNSKNQSQKFGIPDASSSVLLKGSTSQADVDALMTLFMNNKSTRQLAQTIIQYNSAAVLGALAYKAHDNWQSGKAFDQVMPITGHDVTQSSPLPQYFSHQDSADEAVLVTTLMQAMIAASKADGLMDTADQKQILLILKAAEQLGFDADDRDFIYELMTRGISLEEIASSVNLGKHKSEVYLAAYFSVSGDNPSGRAFLEELESALNIDNGLPIYLERQADLGIA